VSERERAGGWRAMRGGLRLVVCVPRPLSGLKGRCEPPLRYGSRSACGRLLTPAPGVAAGRVGKRRSGVASDKARTATTATATVRLVRLSGWGFS